MIVFESVSLQPDLETISVAVYVPALLYVYVGLVAVDVPPVPKLQALV